MRLRVRTDFDQGDQPGIARELHTLKGLAATMGALALADFARTVEARLKDGGGGR